VQLKELTHLVASRKEDPRGKLQRASSIPADIASLVPKSQLEAFEKAGWVFHDRSAEDRSEFPAQAKVFLKASGRLALGTNMLTVQLPDDPSEEKANEMLQPYGCRVVRQLKFAPGLFQVALTDKARGDVIDTANQLEDSGLVEFAEPELIEEIDSRF
jgi:hypothetical protein